MTIRYRAALLLTSLLLTATAAAPHRRPARAMPPAADVYSARALRRARIILELKLLELRKAKLERVLRAIRQNIPIDRILQDAQ